MKKSECLLDSLAANCFTEETAERDIAVVGGEEEIRRPAGPGAWGLLLSLGTGYVEFRLGARR